MPTPFDPQAVAQEAGPEISSLLEKCPDVAPLRYWDGEFLILEGDVDEDLFLVLKGSLIVERGGPPATNLAILMCVPEEPVMVGEMAYFGDRRRTASVRSVGSTLALRLAPRHVDFVVGSLPGLTRILLQQLTRRLRESNDALQGYLGRFQLDPRPLNLVQGEGLFSEGDGANTLYQVITGSVRIREAGAERDVGPEELPDGFLGLEDFLRARPHRYSASAAASSFLMVLDGARREDFVRCYPGLALQILDSGT
jgi:CRP-like cAMP-binding protein